MSNQFKLKIIQDTFLTTEAQPVETLAANQKHPLKIGDEYPIANFHEFDDIHFRLAFGLDAQGQQIFFPGPEGKHLTTWLIFEGHCALLNADGTPAHQFFTKLHLTLQDFLGNHTLRLSMDAIAANKVLAIQIQERLIALQFLDSVADGLFGPISSAAMKDFQTTLQLEEQGFLGSETAEKLLHTAIADIPKPALRLSNDLASRIIRYMQAENYRIATRPDEYNIVYLEGANEDGRPNTDQPDQFNDRRLLVEIEHGVPKIIGNWEATTEPGAHYTYQPISNHARRLGAARIKFGQYKAWRIDIHGTAEPHLALVQVGSISVHRDLNKDFVRTNDYIETGSGFGINQHWGYDYARNTILDASAGCLVGRTRKGHKAFMELLKQDRRYRLNKSYTFDTTIIPGDDLHSRFPPD